MWRRPWGFVLVAVLPSLAWGQSLGEVAQKEKERRKQNEQAGVKSRVITEEDLKANKGQLANDPNEAKPVPAATTSPQGRSLLPRGASGSSGSGLAQQEAAWRSRAAQARARLAEATKDYDFVNSQHLATGERFVDQRGRTLVSSPEQLQAMVKQSKAALDAAQKAWDDLEESARRQSIPPGWLR